MIVKKPCAEAHRRVYGYLDGEIGPYRRWKIRRHLRRCPPCQDGFDFETKLQKRVRDGCREDIPRELLDRLRASIRQDGPDRPAGDGTGGG